MKKLVLSIIAVFAIAFAANANNYKVNDSAIDALIETSTEVYTADFMTTAPAAAIAPAAKEVNPTTALILNIFLGWCAIHRHYCGTAPWMWAAYLFTGGGIFGILDMVDFIMLIVGLSDGSGAAKFINNPKFIAWI